MVCGPSVRRPSRWQALTVEDDVYGRTVEDVAEE